MTASVPPLLEIAANSLGSALAAEAGGANRVELCANLRDAGTTASYGTLAVVRDHLRIPVFALIRPRTGDFCYDSADLDVMVRDIEACVALGIDGIVIGALDADGDVDVTTCSTLVSAAAALEVTFHRAFDVARDAFRALDAIITLNCNRVLTSGGAPTALEGVDRIAELVDRAGSRISVMAGAGVNALTVREVVARSHVREVHASARAFRKSLSRYRSDHLPELDPDRWETDPFAVRAIIEALSHGG